TWRMLERLDGTTLPASKRDGYYVDAAGVHILTRHLTYFALGLDNEPPAAPTHVGGAVGADGLTVRWIPGRDNSGRISHVILYVNGESYRIFGPTEYEAKLGPTLENDTRTFFLRTVDAAGNVSAPSATLRALPKIVGVGVEQARAALEARGFQVGSVTYRAVPGVAAGTVVAPVDVVFGVDGARIDLVVAGTEAPQTRLVFQVANAKRIGVKPKQSVVATNIRTTRPADVTATLYSPQRAKLYTWRTSVKPGRTVVKLKLPVQVRRPGVYRIVWVATSGSETVRKTVTFRLVGPKLQQLTPVRKPIEVVLTGSGGKDALQPGLAGSGARIVATATPHDTFLLVASNGRNVGVVVVDADRYGMRFVRDLRTVFPELKVIVLSQSAKTRRQALKAGVVRALPKPAAPATLSKAIARVAAGK
ncbi:MAG TPA: hypothetical protein VM204_09525, partial [Gaiellaceae bacterium]|nr:hypothetical protein [Gaiellaceae bacterium]